MKDFNDILNAFLVEIEENPSVDVDDIIKKVASDMRDSENRLSNQSLSEISKSITYIDDIGAKLKDLERAQDEGYSRDDWFMEHLNNKMNNLPRLSKEQKSKIVSSIFQSIKSALKNQ